ncbi:hypothetical protein B4082_0665 [Bacillus cereus]|uniref:Uncharacterized protein n=1 Tax=Bacillus cereus TaxID=1396 RepID=A0A162NDP9_BACCE|nr:hypothetical protein B4082_0665 [Bacillus cereus]
MKIRMKYFQYNQISHNKTTIMHFDRVKDIFSHIFIKRCVCQILNNISLKHRRKIIICIRISWFSHCCRHIFFYIISKHCIFIILIMNIQWSRIYVITP